MPISLCLKPADGGSHEHIATETSYTAMLLGLRKIRTRECSVLFEQERDAVRIVQIPRSHKEDDLVEKLFAVLDRFCKALH